jgi:hypothetical protein
VQREDVPVGVGQVQATPDGHRASPCSRPGWQVADVHSTHHRSSGLPWQGQTFHVSRTPLIFRNFVARSNLPHLKNRPSLVFSTCGKVKPSTPLWSSATSGNDPPLKIPHLSSSQDHYHGPQKGRCLSPTCQISKHRYALPKREDCSHQGYSPVRDQGQPQIQIAPSVPYLFWSRIADGGIHSCQDNSVVFNLVPPDLTVFQRQPNLRWQRSPSHIICHALQIE